MALNRSNIAASCRAELRSILRQLEELRTPLTRFERVPGKTEEEPRFRVQFDFRPRRDIQGLRIGINDVRLPDERILELVLHLAKSLWHLKDHLKRWAEISGSSLDIESEVKKHAVLLLCADLANRKKHCELDRPRSPFSPKLDLVSFDFSRNGVLELFHDSSAADKEVLVSVPVPIPFKVQILTGNGQALGDAYEVMRDALKVWLPIIRLLGLLSDNSAESKFLVRELFLAPRF